MKKPNSASIIIAGGGTGGHVLAGVAIAEAWRDQFGFDSLILFVGAQGGIEEKLIPRAGYPLKLLKIGLLKGMDWKKKVRTMIQLPASLIHSAQILWKVRPQAVIGVGGYASGPLVLMARLIGWIWDIETAILEQNSVPGFTNRILGRFVHRIFLTFPDINHQFPRHRTLISGNPIRSSIRPLKPASRNPFTIFIFGGSQGAIGINTLVLEALPLFKELKIALRFIHQTGEKDYERVLEGHRKAGTDARVEKFIHDMPSAYEGASLLICRAGSSTLAETAAVGRAAILVPFPFASDQHQEKNARLFVDAGAARLLIQGEAHGADLAKMIREMTENLDQIEKMEKSVAVFYRPHAAKEIVAYLSERRTTSRAF